MSKGTGCTMTSSIDFQNQFQFHSIKTNSQHKDELHGILHLQLHIKNNIEIRLELPR